ncbi:MAG: hypothetical protein KF730_06225 [Sphingomonas sp.]|uniref:nuclear transport factor 2 family protein n=1 Tax=Sphingomonas sp. TaxID=28214 RepID=UPI0025F2996E|nr:nuclear transport factor 2 family protein [Sphingomonas sp.]MBX3564160.1 hypothetical protein [Sphingomonas sp.]
MDRVAQLLAIAELERGIADFWHDVDTDWGRKAAQFYAEDAVYEAEPLKLVGREAIQRFYSWREDRGDRTAVHGVLNFRADFEDEHHAVATWYMLLYAADGTPPHPSEPPTRISRVTENYRWDAGEDRWLCARRYVENLFRGGSQLNAPAALNDGPALP